MGREGCKLKLIKELQLTNEQVADFYDRMGLKLERTNDDGVKEYSAQVETLDTIIKDYYNIE